MQSTDFLSKGLDHDISDAHERFVAAMEQRLPHMALETKERYFAVLSILVGKLETDGKNLRQIVQEMVAEAAGHLLQELGS